MITVIIQLEVDFGQSTVGQLIVSVGGGLGPVVVGAGDRALAELFEGGPINIGFSDGLPVGVCV